MTIETDGQQAGAEGAADNQPSQVDAAPAANSEDTAEQQTGAEETGQADEAGEQPRRTPWWEKRFSELTAKRHDAERDAAYWRGLAEAGQRQAPQQPVPTGPPTEEEYNWDQAAYREALDRYVAEQAEKAADRAFQKRTSEQQQQTQLETATSRLKEGAAKHSDFEAVVHDIPITEAVRELLVGDPNAASILYQVGKDSAEKARIFSLSPYQQAVELGKIAARLEGPAAHSPKPIPPAPPATVGGVSAGLNKSLGDMSMAEFIAARNAGKS